MVAATPFTALVLNAVRRIPPGRVATYGDIAALAGRPRAWRAVGNIMRAGRAPGMPCHRVVAAGGRLGRLRRQPGHEAGAARRRRRGRGRHPHPELAPRQVAWRRPVRGRAEPATPQSPYPRGNDVRENDRPARQPIMAMTPSDRMEADRVDRTSCRAAGGANLPRSRSCTSATAAGSTRVAYRMTGSAADAEDCCRTSSCRSTGASTASGARRRWARGCTGWP